MTIGFLIRARISSCRNSPDFIDKLDLLSALSRRGEGGGRGANEEKVRGRRGMRTNRASPPPGGISIPRAPLVT
jgi:hypothetical protein